MSLIDLRPFASPGLCRLATPGEILAAHQQYRLTEIERQEVQTILAAVAGRLVREATDRASISRRLGAIVDALIEVTDAIDGDTDLESQCEDEGAQCEDEGSPDDNGLADADGLAEQLCGDHL